MRPILLVLFVFVSGILFAKVLPDRLAVDLASSPTSTSTAEVVSDTATTTPAPLEVTSEEPKPKEEPKEKIVLSAATTSAPKPTLTKPPSDIAAEIAEGVFTETNAERVKNGLPALMTDSKLSLIASAHSADMLASNYFSHTNKSDCNSACRVKNAAYAYSAVGENIFMTYGFSLSEGNTASLVVQGWMGSEGHRANILQKLFTNSGIGVASQGNRMYITAMYSKPR